MKMAGFTMYPFTTRTEYSKSGENVKAMGTLRPHIKLQHNEASLRTRARRLSTVVLNSSNRGNG